MLFGGVAISAAAGGISYAVTRERDAALKAGAYTFVGLSAWEAFWYVKRWLRRSQVFELAQAWAKKLNRPLVVVGAPDGGVTSGYGCGDLTIDLSPTACPNPQAYDITKPTPISNNSVVVFCSCVLEYVSDPYAAIAEIERISGGHAFFVGVEPWTLAGHLYPGAKQTLPAAYL
jgi:hypothetical protein